VQWVLSGGPVHRGIARATRPRGVPAAVTEASEVADEGLIGPVWVAVWAVLWCPHHPRARSGPDWSPTAGDSLSSEWPVHDDVAAVVKIIPEGLSAGSKYLVASH
jgi:hypothetical protein